MSNDAQALTDGFLNAYRMMNAHADWKARPEKEEREGELHELRRSGLQLRNEGAGLRNKATGNVIQKQEYDAARQPVLDARKDEFDGYRLKAAKRSDSYADEDRADVLARRGHQRASEAETRSRWGREAEDRRKASREQEIAGILPSLSVMFKEGEGALPTGESAKVRKTMLKHGFDIDALASPEAERHLSEMQELEKTGNVTKGSLAAIDFYLKPLTERGIGEQTEKGEVVGKRISNILWGDDSKTLSFELEVDYEKDGKVTTETAPVTELRSSDPKDKVSRVSPRDLIRHLQSRMKLQQGLVQLAGGKGKFNPAEKGLSGRILRLQQVLMRGGMSEDDALAEATSLETSKKSRGEKVAELATKIRKADGDKPRGSSFKFYVDEATKVLGGKELPGAEEGPGGGTDRIATEDDRQSIVHGTPKTSGGVAGYNPQADATLDSIIGSID